ncbi:MAG: helix-turn-helix transcriptional regulator [Firmicutes bacterium]|nr:helix-turn-helix transcriptional regulator [Bacillota bacterium]
MLLFDTRLKEMRKKNHLTQEELANMVGLTKTSICCYENGTRTPTLDTLIDLANALNVELTYFLGVDIYMVASDDSSYGVNLAKDEISLIKELRKHIGLYNKLLKDPKRVIELIEKKMR